MSLVQDVGWAPSPVLTGVENLAPHLGSISVIQACSESLYGLRYPGPSNFRYYVLIHLKVLEKSTMNLSQVNLETAHPNVGLPLWSNAKVIHSTCLLT